MPRLSSESTVATKKQESIVQKMLKLSIKLVVSAACFWYISQKIDFSASWQAMKSAEWTYLFVAVFLYIVSKVIAAFRLNIYFSNINLKLPVAANLKLYWLGMFYNLFLPGSISGDAYKVVLLNKRMAAPYKKTSAAVLLDRISGLLGLGILLAAYGMVVLNDIWLDLLLVSGAFSAIIIFFVVNKLYFKSFLPGFFPTLILGIVVQAVQVLGLLCILFALELHADQAQWIFIFLIANVVAVFPFSLGGGLGTRELVFTEGALYFMKDPHLGVTISLLFYLSSVAGSAWGAWYIFNDPLKREMGP